MTKRDVEIINEVCRVEERWVFPETIVFAPARNTVRHLLASMTTLRDSGIRFDSALGLQSTGDAVLGVVDRTNISKEKLLTAQMLKEAGLPMPSEMIIGLPGWTVASVACDLHFAFDQELQLRVHVLQLLANSPMADDDWCRMHGLVFDDDGFVVQSNTFDEADLAHMRVLVRSHLIVDHFAVFNMLVPWLHPVTHEPYDLLPPSPPLRHSSGSSKSTPPGCRSSLSTGWTSGTRPRD